MRTHAVALVLAAAGCAGTEAPRSGGAGGLDGEAGPVLQRRASPAAPTATATAHGGGIARDPMPPRSGKLRLVQDPTWPGGMRVVEDVAVTDRGPAPGPAAPEPPPVEEVPAAPEEPPKLIEIPPPH